MSCLLTVDDSDQVNQINIDDLYERQHQKDLKQLSIFNKILNRVHRQINLHQRLKKNEKHIWFTVPEFLFGEPLYDKGDCIAYLVNKLDENGFDVKYMYPNTLFVSWERWVPAYKRFEIKKKFGVNVDEKGNIIEKKDDIDELKEQQNGGGGGGTNKKQYTPIDAYKPAGNLVYNQDIFDKLEKKINSEKRVSFK